MRVAPQQRVAIPVLSPTWSSARAAGASRRVFRRPREAPTSAGRPRAVSRAEGGGLEPRFSVTRSGMGEWRRADQAGWGGIAQDALDDVRALRPSLLPAAPALPVDPAASARVGRGARAAVELVAAAVARGAAGDAKRCAADGCAPSCAVVSALVADPGPAAGRVVRARAAVEQAPAPVARLTAGDPLLQARQRNTPARVGDPAAAGASAATHLGRRASAALQEASAPIRRGTAVEPLVLARRVGEVPRTAVTLGSSGATALGIPAATTPPGEWTAPAVQQPPAAIGRNPATVPKLRARPRHAPRSAPEPAHVGPPSLPHTSGARHVHAVQRAPAAVRDLAAVVTVGRRRRGRGRRRRRRGPRPRRGRRVRRGPRRLAARHDAGVDREEPAPWAASATPESSREVSGREASGGSPVPVTPGGRSPDRSRSRETQPTATTARTATTRARIGTTVS